MSVSTEQVQEIANELGAKFAEFKKSNDTALGAVKQELAGAKDAAAKQAEEVKGLQKSKDELEAQIKKQNRPGANTKQVDEHKEAFARFMIKGNEEGLAELQQKALSTGVDADGGFAVPEVIDTEITNLLRDASPMRQVARVITVGSPDYKRLVNLHGGKTGWVGETDARPNTDTPKQAQVTPFWGELYANPEATQTMLDDSFFNAEQWLSSEVIADFAEAEGAAFTTGDGTKKPKGLLSYATAATADKVRAFGTIQHKESGASGALTADDIKTIPYLLKAGYRMGAKFMGNSSTLGDLMSLKNAQGDYIWRPGLELGQPSTLGAHAFIENEDMPDIAAGANALAFGDFMRAYYILDRSGTRVLRDPFTNKPYVGFYTTKRVGGMLVDSNAVKFIKIKA